MIDYRRFFFVPPPAFRGKMGNLRITSSSKRFLIGRAGTPPTIVQGGYDCPVAYHDVTRLHFPKRPPTYPWLRAEDDKT